MKYFFLSEGWTVGRVWSVEGPWDEVAWRRPPQIECTGLSIANGGEVLWLHRAEEAVLMLEVKPSHGKAGDRAIGQVMLRRLIDANAALERLSQARAVCHVQKQSF